jgi:HrpA-like RNA helicase
MSERFNGNVPYTRRTHGSERRGFRPVPALNFALRQEQSQQDKARVLALIHEQHERITEEELGIGNRDLPAFNHKIELVANIEAHKAVIVGGETGSGKSTQLPQYLYEAGYDMTIMLVPRRVIADGLGDRIREELAGQIEGIDANETVGIIHGERVERHENNKIMVMTPNTFIKMEKDLRELYGGKKLAIVADEIHEANLFTEIAVGVAALSVQEHEDWRLVAASATHNAETLQKPFQKLNAGYVPSVEIKGRPFNVELREEPELNPMQAYARDGTEHEKAMIFTSGKKEIKYIIEETQRELEAREKGSSKNVIFRILHGELTEAELSHINDPIPEGYRLVIVSSPAGMSGITIPGVTYVATDGTINRSELDDDRAGGLRRRHLSKAGIIQQIGRAGRDVPGGIGVLCAPVVAKRLNTKKSKRKDDDTLREMQYIPFVDREEHEPPEIYSTNLSRIVLSAAALGYRFAEINEFIPHPVQQLDIINAEEALIRIGALDDEGIVTELGKVMDKFPVTPELARGLYEASRRGKSLQHMARAAFIAAAVDVGGLQDHTASESAVKARKQIIRSTTADDFIAQLDLMTKLYERTTEEWTGYEFVERHGLHPKRVERVRKTTRKILGVMGMHPQNIIVTPPLPDEEKQLRDDFTSGFIDFVYEDVGNAPRSRKAVYRNIHGDSSSPKRTISDRSIGNIPRRQLVAGIPRWYEKGTRKDGTPIKHDIIDHVFMVDSNVVGNYAIKNGLVQGIWKGSRMMGDQVSDFEQGTFGSILVGTPIKRTPTEAISAQAQEVLVDYVVKHQGRVQRGLRDLADALEGYRARTPAYILDGLRMPDAPRDITQNGITEMIKAAARRTDTAHGIEDTLAKYLYKSNITLGKYYDAESLQKLNELSPQELFIAGEAFQIQYENTQPYITNVTKEQLMKLRYPIYLADGREILCQIRLPEGGTERISFGAIDFQ